MRLLTACLLVGLLPSSVYCQLSAQDSTLHSFNNISDKTLDKLSDSYAKLNTSVGEQSQKLLQGFQSSEAKLSTQLQAKDSNEARQLFAKSASFYQEIQARLQSPQSDPLQSIKNYIPGIDSMQTTIQFLSKSGLSTDKLQKLQALSQQLKQLQGSLANAGVIQQYITQREAFLQSKLSQYGGLTKQLSGMSTRVFYYQQQLSQYKDILNNRQQQEQLILTAVRQIPAFQQFWQKNSMLSQLFPQPANTGTLLSGAGLQTSAQVGKLIQQRLGTAKDDNGQGGGQFLQQQAAQAQDQVAQLKQKLDKLNLPGGSSDMALPDLTPNSQRNKTFLKRLEFSFNIQNTNATVFLPTISTLGLNVGYKLSDKATVGVGLSYLLGLGNGLDQIRLSNQGAGLRSFVDIKVIKSFWLTGGFEYNYMEQFTSIKIIRDLSLWQRSALVGVMKKFNVGKRSGSIQVLYDMLAAQEMPQGQAFKVRFGYSL
jgi:hypothetical protein